MVATILVLRMDGLSIARRDPPGKVVLRAERSGPADPPPDYRQPAPEITGPSVVEGRNAGIEVGQYAPDFELQPIEPYPILTKWLGDDTLDKGEGVRLAQLVGKAPIMLLYGSYT